MDNQESSPDDIGPSSPGYPESKSTLYRYLVKGEVFMSCVALVVVFVLILTQVFFRKVLNSPLNWSEELARFVFIWLVFTAATFVMARRKHIVVALFGSKRIGARAISIIEALACVVALAGCVVMIFASSALVTSSSAMTGSVTGVPMAAVYSILVASFSLMSVHLLVNIYLALRYPEQFEESIDLSRVGV